jgi:hypothetical protein
MAHVGDLRGRKQIFTLSIFLMALPTLGIGLLPTYAKLATWAPTDGTEISVCPFSADEVVEPR